MAMDVTTAKAIAMLALGLGSFFTGMIPACFSNSTRQRHPLFTSCLVCFGAGVLLSTSIVHMLPETRGVLANYTELIFCAGFFLVYLVDEIMHFFNGAGHTAAPVSRRNYGSGEQSSLLHNDGEMRERCCGDAGNPRMCHVSHTEPCNKSFSGIIGLLCALLVHSFLEGLAIGVQESSSQILLLLGAVASHKFVVGFCLGVELSASTSLCAHIVSVTLFSGGSVAGIGAGAGLDFVAGIKDSIAIPIMQGLAAGTMLYVTVSEVLPRERAHWHERRRIAGVAQFFAVGLGFMLMFLTTKYLDRD